MIKTLPFSALRTLESVVRLRGFGRAANELNVTQSAVSQHIKALEEWLGQPLLIRKPQSTEPTEAGQRLADAVRDGFGLVEEVCDTLRGTRREQGDHLRVSSPPGFAYLWLLPRLLSFDEAHPDIPVSLSTEVASRDPEHGSADVTIAYSPGGFPGLHADRLLTEELAPVCAPALAATLSSVTELGKHVILQDVPEHSGDPSSWEAWALETGTKLPAFPRKRRFSQTNLVVQAAVDGLGVAMGRSPLVERLLAEGKLVHPFPQTAPSQHAYWIVCTHDALNRPAVAAFRNWLLDTAENAAPSDGG